MAVKLFGDFYMTPIVRPGMRFITVLAEGEEVIGVEDGCLITNMRVVDAREIADAPVEPPLLADPTDALRAKLFRTHYVQLIIRILISYGFFIDPDSGDWSGT